MPSDRTTGTPEDLRALTTETQAIWDQNADFWDERMGEGNLFQLRLVGPAAERLLALRAGKRVLDVACGNGVFARRLAELGAQVTACDFSARLIERARERGAATAERITYAVVDATDEQQLLALGEGSFDAAVCNMAIMDMTTIEPLLRALRHLLTPEGRFVFTLTHPCFNTADVRLSLEEEDREGDIVTTRSVRIARYLTSATRRGLAIIGQPTPHFYFDRPLSAILSTCFASGWVMDGIEEPGFSAEDSSPRPLSWANYTEIPPVFAARLRPAR